MQVLVSGGSSANCAGLSTPASSLSYLVSLADGSDHGPVQEEMPAARVVGPLL